MYKKIMQPGS